MLLVVAGAPACNASSENEPEPDAATTTTSSPTEERVTSTTGAPPVKVVLDDDGIVVDEGEKAVVLRFDEKKLDDVKNAVASMLGPPTKEVDQQCDSGADHAVTWTGLTIYGTDGTFTGWYAERERLTTDAGVGPGSTKADIDKAYGSGNVEIHETTLGTEWSAGGVSGIFEGGADTEIAGMWAGTNCVFR